MTICGGCKKYIKTADKCTCSRVSCARHYHCACVNLTVDAYKKLPSWVCPFCTVKQPKGGDNSDTPVKLILTVPVEDEGRANVTVRKGTSTPTSPNDDTDIPAALEEAAMARLIRKEVTRALKDVTAVQFKALGDRLSGLETSVQYLSGQCDDMFKYYSDTKANMAILSEENKQLREELQEMKKRTKNLEDAQARQEQWSRAQNVEVIGVPETKDECVVDVIVKIAAQTGVILHSSEIEFAHRVQPRRAAGGSTAGAAAGRAIVARFRQRATKDAVVAAARKHRNVTTQQLGIGGEVKRIFINEHLTKDNKQLLKSCKIVAAENNYKHVWTKNCRIYIRKTDTSPAIPIISMSDLEKIK